MKSRIIRSRRWPPSCSASNMINLTKKRCASRSDRPGHLAADAVIPCLDHRVLNADSLLVKLPVELKSQFKLNLFFVPVS